MTKQTVRTANPVPMRKSATAEGLLDLFEHRRPVWNETVVLFRSLTISAVLRWEMDAVLRSEAALGAIGGRMLQIWRDR